MAPDERVAATFAALRAAERLLASALDSVTEGSLVTDAARRTIYCNRTFTLMTGYDITDLLGVSCSILQGPATDLDSVEQVRRALNAGDEYRGRLLNYRRDGSAFWNELSISPIRDSGGEITNFVSVQRDVTSEVQHERDFQRGAARDLLTGPPLRAAVIARLRDSLNEARLRGTMVSLGIIDIDGFTSINHELGHAFGDEILVELGSRLTARTRVDDTLARWDGGRFLVVVRGLDERLGTSHLRGIIERLVAAAIEPLTLSNGQRIPVTLRYGFALWPRDAEDADGLLRVAEASVEHAKTARQASG